MRKTIQRYLQVGRHRAFRRFWLGMMISRAGDAFTAVALSWVVLGLAGPVIAGLFLAFAALPVLAVGLSARPGARGAARAGQNTG